MTTIKNSQYSEYILHIDMNAFYASCELLRHHEYINMPLVVGDGERAVVSAASYEARKYGIHSAMPVFRARQLCQNAIFLPVDMPYYQKISDQVFDILFQYSYKVEKIGLDEAFLDVSCAVKLHGSPIQIAQKIKASIKKQLNLICTIGIAQNKCIAKILSGLAKPTDKRGESLSKYLRFTQSVDDGILLVKSDNNSQFLSSLPLKKIWGIGPKTIAKFANYGVSQVDEMLKMPKTVIYKIMGNKNADKTISLLNGDSQDDDIVISSLEKSVSNENTLKKDSRDELILSLELQKLSYKVSQRLKEKGLMGYTVSLICKFDDLQRVTKNNSLPLATNSRFKIYQNALKSLKGILDQDRRAVRLIGVSVSKLIPSSESEYYDTLLDVRSEKEKAFEKIDQLNIPLHTYNIDI